MIRRSKLVYIIPCMKYGDLRIFTVVVHPPKRRSCATVVNPVFSPYNEKPIGLALVLKRDLFL